MNLLKGMLAFILLPSVLWAQVLPVEGSTLNYRIVGFAGPELRQEKYKLEIAKGNYTSTVDFKKHIAQKISGNKDSIVAEVAAFDATYTWGVVSGGKMGVLHHFSTGIVPNADTAKWRLRMIKKSKKYKDGYVFLDGNRALYDIHGMPVWFLPEKNDFLKEAIELRDLKATPQGTITFLLADKPYEVDYNGNILWRAPDKGIVSGEEVENFHHEFTRLENGNYMVMGDEHTFWRMGADGHTELVDKSKINRDSIRSYKRVQMGTMIEFDAKGNIVWSWHMSDYFAGPGQDLFYHIRQNGTPDIAVHDNSFFFDEKENMLYISMRNISRIIKIKYPGAELVSQYGERFEKGIPEKFNSPFCREHCCRVSQKGYLYLYDNNVCNRGSNWESMPKLVMMRQPADKNGQPEMVWEYECSIDKDFDKKKYGYDFTRGGSVQELPDGNIFACMGGSYSKVFIVNEEKKILWSALPEKWDDTQKAWMPFYSYRASYINGRDELEQLIWHK